MVIDRYRTYQPRYQQRQRPRHHYGRSFAVALLVMAGLVVGKSATKSLLAEKQSPPQAAASPKPKKVVMKADPIPPNTWNELNQQLDALISQHESLAISVALIDIGTNTKANYGYQDNFAGASTTKVLTAAAYLKQVEQGDRTLTQTIGGANAKQQLKQMINQSNNNAWAALNSNLTYARIESYANSIGIKSYQSKNNTITASDEALLLEKLYKRELLNEEHTALLLSYMQKTNNEAMLPVVTPEGATIYHKYGQLEDRLHDAGIIVHQDRPIVLVIYTKGGATDGSNYAGRVALINELAQTVFDVIY